MNKATLVLDKIGIYIFFGLLIYIPFHVFLSNWLGSSLGVLGATKVLKEPVLAVGFVSLLIAKRDVFFGQMLGKERLLYGLLGAYIVLTCLSALVRNNGFEPEVLGLAYNVRYLIFFVYGALVYKTLGKKAVDKGVRFVLAAGILVAALGTIQVFALPDSTLSEFGYSRETGTPEVFYISDATKDTERAYSTLKDPNSLGSYLVIVLCIFIVAIGTYAKNVDWRLVLLVGLLLLLALFLTYSRSAWVGLLIAVVSLLLAAPKTIKMPKFSKQQLLLALTGVMLGVFILFILLSGSYLFDNVILHEVEGKTINSNSNRITAISYSVRQVLDNPLGYGIGSAGPVSYKNNRAGAVIPENYYLQIALEVGVAGLILFVSIVAVVAYKLYVGAKAGDALTAALLAALLAVSMANMFNHIWVSEAVAYTWWGLAGLVAFSNTNNKKPAKN